MHSLVRIVGQALCWPFSPAPPPPPGCSSTVYSKWVCAISRTGKMQYWPSYKVDKQAGVYYETESQYFYKLITLKIRDILRVSCHDVWKANIRYVLWYEVQFYHAWSFVLSTVLFLPCMIHPSHIFPSPPPHQVSFSATSLIKGNSEWIRCNPIVYEERFPV